MPPQMAIALARLRIPAVLALAGLLVAGGFWHFLPGGWPGWAVWAGFLAGLSPTGYHLVADEAAAVNRARWRGLTSS